MLEEALEEEVVAFRAFGFVEFETVFLGMNFRGVGAFLNFVGLDWDPFFEEILGESFAVIVFVDF